MGLLNQRTLNDEYVCVESPQVYSWTHKVGDVEFPK